MNLSFVTNTHKAYERHMLEHLMFYRTKNFKEKLSFLYFLNENNVEINFYSRMDFMELTFSNVTEEIKEIIKKEFETSYFTKDDFDLEKKVILIEEKNSDQSKIDLYKKSFLHNNKVESYLLLDYFKNETFENMLVLNNTTKWRIVEFSDKKYLEKSELDTLLKKDLEVSSVIIRENILIFNFSHDKRLREIFIYISIILEEENYFIKRHINFIENSLCFYLSEFELFAKDVENILNKNYSKAKARYNEDFLCNSVDVELFKMINMDDMIDQKERCKQIKNIFSKMQIAFNNYENRN